VGRDEGKKRREVRRGRKRKEGGTALETQASVR
jgi:hypothetical protein